MNTESEIPLTGLYADEAPSGLIEPPTSAQFHAGVEPEMTLPAAWWNYFANLFTNTNIKAKLDILAILAELNNALVAAGITPDPGLNNQLVTLLRKGHGSTVNADKLDGLEAGNASGQIPVSNGALNTNLIAASAAACSGNAASATKLQTARTIGGVSFNGTANINLPGVNTQGNQNTSGKAATAGAADTAAVAGSCSGNAATATVLQTTRKIGGVNFNGSADINLPGVNTTGNQNTTGNAATATSANNATNAVNVNLASRPVSGSQFLAAFTTDADGNQQLKRGPRVNANSADENTWYWFGRSAEAASITLQSVPGGPTSSGTKGRIAADSSYLYICIATNTWRRVSISAWAP